MLRSRLCVSRATQRHFHDTTKNANFSYVRACGRAYINWIIENRSFWLYAYNRINYKPNSVTLILMAASGNEAKVPKRAKEHIHILWYENERTSNSACFYGSFFPFIWILVGCCVFFLLLIDIHGIFNESVMQKITKLRNKFFLGVCVFLLLLPYSALIRLCV